MSWSINVPTTPGVDFMAAAEKAELETPYHIEDQQPESPEEARYAFTKAVEACNELIYAGVLGAPTESFKATLSGHSNPGHITPPGFSYDFVNIVLSRATSLEAHAALDAAQKAHEPA